MMNETLFHGSDIRIPSIIPLKGTKCVSQAPVSMKVVSVSKIPELVPVLA